MLGITDYPAFVAAILLFLAIPGPGNLALVSSTAQGGVRGGLGATFGLIAKAIVFYMAFFPLFVDPSRRPGLLTFGAMALTVAVLTLAYGAGAILLTHLLAERLRANARLTSALNKLAGMFLIGFGVRLALTK